MYELGPEDRVSPEITVREARHFCDKTLGAIARRMGPHWKSFGAEAGQAPCFVSFAAERDEYICQYRIDVINVCEVDEQLRAEVVANVQGDAFSYGFDDEDWVATTETGDDDEIDDELFLKEIRSYTLVMPSELESDEFYFTKALGLEIVDIDDEEIGWYEKGYHAMEPVPEVSPATLERMVEYGEKVFDAVKHEEQLHTFTQQDMVDIVSALRATGFMRTKN